MMSEEPQSAEQTIRFIAARAHEQPSKQTPAAAPSGGAWLIALHPSLMHREYAVRTDRVIVGRDAETSAIVCSGPTISRQHLAVTTVNGVDYVVEDLNSTNGVFVNRQRIKGMAPLADGDLIGLGSDKIVHLRFQLESSRNRPWVERLPPKPAWEIGRAPACDVSLAFESTVSWKHAVLRPHNGRIEIIDPGSLNGVWLNGRRIRRTPLTPTDSVMIGSTVLRFELLDDGALRVVRRDFGGQVALECVALTRDVGGGGLRSRAKRILDRVSLSIQPGEFVGLLGPSGAGKSTLLKSLNGYTPPTYGCVLLNETPLYPCFDMFRNVIGYVPQDDIVHPELTVESSLDYIARLRLPPDVTAQQRRELIDSTIETLGLSHVRANHIYELSGGQRKRVSIGCELITRPSILFLDEPTSGMDPSTEERLMRHFQGMASRGTTVLITTHILYNLGLLDRIVILARGRLVFFGTPHEAAQFFTIRGRPIERPTQIFEILEGEHPIENLPGAGDPKDRIAEHFSAKYLGSEFFTRHVGSRLSGAASDMQAVEIRSSQKEPKRESAASTVSPQTANAYRALLERPTAGAKRRGPKGIFSGRGLATLTRRNFAIKLVSPRRALFYLAVPIVLALVTLTLRTSDLPDDAEMAQRKQEIVSNLTYQPPNPMAPAVSLGDPIKKLLAPDGLDDPRPAEDVVFALKYEGLPNLPTPISVLLMFVMTSVFMGTLMSCLDLSPERPIYIRERMANQRIGDYLGSKLPFLLSVTAIQCLLFLLMCRTRPGLRHFDFPSAYLAMLAMAWASCAMGLFLSAIDPTSGQFSVILAIVAVLPQLVFSGGLGPDFYQGMSKTMKGFACLLPARWGLEMLMTAFYRDPDREALRWVADFVSETIGFQFGPKVYLYNTLVLTAQALAWMGVCAWAIKRLDRAR